MRQLAGGISETRRKNLYDFISANGYFKVAYDVRWHLKWDFTALMCSYFGLKITSSPPTPTNRNADVMEFTTFSFPFFCALLRLQPHSRVH